MNISEYQNKITKAAEKVAKIKSTVDKHTKARDKKRALTLKFIENHNIEVDEKVFNDAKSLWYLKYRDELFYIELCDVVTAYYDKEEAVKESNKKLEEAKRVLNNWTEKLRAEQVKLQYIQDNVPQVIKDFLNTWKNTIFKHIQELRDEYLDEYPRYKDSINKVYFEFIQKNKDKFRYVDTDNYNPDVNYRYDVSSWRDIDEIIQSPKYMHIEESFLMKFHDSLFAEYRSRKWNDDWLDSTLTEEMNSKLIDLMSRVSKITGEIVDARLTIEKGDLNGTVIGKDGTARVNTIGAGGYNIQIRHYRVLVKKVKEK